jgi:hypothetical protein
MRRIAALIVAAVALAVIPPQAQADKVPECLARQATVFNNKSKNNYFFSVGYDQVLVVKGNNNTIEVSAPPAGKLGNKSYVCIEGKHNRLSGTFFRAYSAPGKDNKIIHSDSPCGTDFQPRFYNFAQVDIQDCQE